MELDIAKWNYERENTKFDPELEVTMLEEEAREFKDGLEMYFKATDSEQKINALVELLDAYADYYFVFNGTRYKLLGNSYNFSHAKDTLDYMEEILNSLGFTYTEMEEVKSIVIEANYAKGKDKVNGKIQKGVLWVDPKTTIREYVEKFYERLQDEINR